MKLIGLDKLTNEIAKPGFERELIPLLQYKGSSNLGKYHRRWNFLISMMLHEVETVSEAVNHFHMRPEFAHLCLPEKKVSFDNMRGFMNRVRDNRAVTDLVPGLTEYAEWIWPHFYPYDRVPLQASRQRKAWWRTFTPQPLGQPPIPLPHDFRLIAEGKTATQVMEHYGRSPPVIYRWFSESELSPATHVREKLPIPDDFYEVSDGRTRKWVENHYGRSFFVVQRWFEESGAQPQGEIIRAPLAYPYLIHEPSRPEHELLRLINDAIPKHFSPDVRADMCQDLAIGILTGEFDQDNLGLPAMEVVKRVYRMFPTKYGPLSLDAPLSSDSDFRLLDTLVDEGRDWA